MAVQRLLGAGWALVHGPRQPEAMLRWLLENGFAGLVAAPGPRAGDWGALVRAAGDLPVSFPAVRASSVLAEVSPAHGLCSNQSADADTARRAVAAAVAVAGQVGTDRVVLDVGAVSMVGDVEQEDLGDSWTEAARDALLARRKAALEGGLDRLCRALFELCKSHPNTKFCLTLSRSLRSLLDLQSLQWVFEDLPMAGLGYWHDTAIAARRHQLLGEAQGQWLESFANRLQGCTLGDATDDGLYLPPGAGGVDYPLLGAYLPRAGKGVAACLELDPAVRAGELPGVRACLDKFDL